MHPVTSLPVLRQVVLGYALFFFSHVRLLQGLTYMVYVRLQGNAHIPLCMYDEMYHCMDGTDYTRCSYFTLNVMY